MFVFIHTGPTFTLTVQPTGGRDSISGGPRQDIFCDGDVLAYINEINL